VPTAAPQLSITINLCAACVGFVPQNAGSNRGMHALGSLFAVRSTHHWVRVLSQAHSQPSQQCDVID